jgi:hypothetical protein
MMKPAATMLQKLAKSLMRSFSIIFDPVPADVDIPGLEKPAADRAAIEV